MYQTPLYDFAPTFHFLLPAREGGGGIIFLAKKSHWKMKVLWVLDRGLHHSRWNSRATTWYFRLMWSRLTQCNKEKADHGVW